MSDQMSHPFPSTRPEISISESTDKIDEIDFIELRWWFVTPQLGDRTMWASYDAETLDLTSVKDMAATVPARIHRVDCTEIQINEWSRENGWRIADGFFYSKTSEAKESQWVAVLWQNDSRPCDNGKKVFFSFQDEGFEGQWGGSGTRRLYDDGKYQLQADGSYKVTDGSGLGAGVYDVTIGDRTFCCLRVLQADLSVPGGGELCEAYVERGGRTVFFRRYDGRFFRPGYGKDLAKEHPNNNRIVLNDAEFVHFNCSGRPHDVITSTGLGVGTGGL
jgi:hypothetical protein